MHVVLNPILTEHYAPAESPWKAKFRKLGILQKQVALHCGISSGHLSDMLNGYRPISDDYEMRFRELEAEIKLVLLAAGAKSCNQ